MPRRPRDNCQPDYSTADTGCEADWSGILGNWEAPIRTECFGPEPTRDSDADRAQGTSPGDQRKEAGGPAPAVTDAGRRCRACPGISPTMASSITRGIRGARRRWRGCPLQLCTSQTISPDGHLARRACSAPSVRTAARATPSFTSSTPLQPDALPDLPDDLPTQGEGGGSRLGVTPCWLRPPRPGVHEQPTD